MDTATVCNILRPLWELSAEVAGTNAHYQILLAERILNSEKPLNQMTLAEILELVELANSDFKAAASYPRRNHENH